MTSPVPPPVLRVVNPDASPEEIAAILAAVGATLAARAAGDGSVRDDDVQPDWVRASRLQSRHLPVQRGAWRLSGRLGRRSRA